MSDLTASLLPDAPIYELLSLRHNDKLVSNMSNEELLAFLGTMKSLATSAPTLTSKLATDGVKIRQPRAKSAAAQVKQNLLDSI